MTLVSVKNLSFYYDREKVLNEVNFEVNPGEFVILTGENGAAKSTLLKNVLGLLKPASGTVTIAKTVASATGAELRPLRTLETVSAEEIAAGADYFSLMRENLANLTK